MDQYVQVSLILGHIYPQYEFKVIFQVAYPPLVMPLGNHFTFGIETNIYILKVLNLLFLVLKFVFHHF